jgi:hypothetical protein
MMKNEFLIVVFRCAGETMLLPLDDETRAKSVEHMYESMGSCSFIFRETFASKIYYFIESRAISIKNLYAVERKRRKSEKWRRAE